MGKNCNSRIRIMQAVGEMNRGGIESWLMRILRQIDRDCFHIDFLVETKKSCAFDDEIRKLGSQVIQCPIRDRLISYPNHLKQILREHGPYDVLHSHNYLFSGAQLRYADQIGIPVRIAHVHPAVDRKKDRFLRGAYRLLMTHWIEQHATHVLAPSQNSLNSFLALCNCGNKYTGTIPIAIDLNRFGMHVDRIDVRQKLSIPLDRTIVTYIARFVSHKNHAQILRIADHFMSNHPDNQNIHFVMAGSHGELMEALKDEVNKRKNVTILIGLEDIANLLMVSDLFFFPSLNEGFGIVAVEACAAGLPVVATDLATIREACPPTYHNLMFPPNDDDTAIGNILDVLNDVELYERLSVDGKQWAANFSTKNSLNSLVRIYKG